MFHLGFGRIGRCFLHHLSIFALVFLVIPAVGAGQHALETPVAAHQREKVPKLRILIVEGEGAINNIRRRTARESIVQVVDENNRPVAGAVVAFQLPEEASAVFRGGSKTFKAVTSKSGLAKLPKKTLAHNLTGPGKMEIQVSATAPSGQAPVTATTTITQTYVVGPHIIPLIGAPLTAATVAVGGAAIVATTVAVTKGGGGQPETKSATISIGTPSLP